MNRFFNSKAVFILMPILYIVATVIYYIYLDRMDAMATACIVGAVLIALVVCHFRHYTLAVQGLIGAILFQRILVFCSSLGYLPVLYSIVLACYAVVFINHFYIASQHTSKPKNMKLNQILLFVIAALMIVGYIWFRPERPALQVVCSIVSEVAIVNAIICIETKIDSYKAERETFMQADSWDKDTKTETKEKYFGK